MLRTSATLLACWLLALGYSGGPPNGKTGRPGEGTCGDCHSGITGTPDSTALAGIPGGSYAPGSVYSMTLSLQWLTQRRWGFELTAVTSAGLQAGQLIVSDSVNTQYSAAAPGYLKQTSAGTHQGTPAGVSWTFRWQAPPAGTGPVTFYWCGNAANGNGLTSGDAPCRDSLVVTEGSGIGTHEATARYCWRTTSPGSDRVVIDYVGDRELPVSIYSTGGLLVRTLHPGEHDRLLRLDWDGRDGAGVPVPPAGYFIRLGDAVRSVVRVQMVR